MTEESVRVAAVDKVDKDFEFDRVFASTEGQETVRRSMNGVPLAGGVVATWYLV